MVMKSKFLETCHTSYRSQQLDNIITKKRFVLWQHCTTEKYGTASVAYKFYNIALRMCSLTLYHDLNIGEGRKKSFRTELAAVVVATCKSVAAQCSK